MAAMVNYFEVGSPDPDAARSFYGSLFDWTFGESSAVGYQMVNGDKGGLWNTTSLGGASWAIFYGRRREGRDHPGRVARRECGPPVRRQRRHRVRAPPGSARQPFWRVATQTTSLN